MWPVIAAGFIIRIALIPGPGFPGDIGAFEDWALAFARFGPHVLYADTSNLHWAAVDYPPAYLLVLGAIGWIALHVFHLTESSGLLFQALVKLPAILADMAIALVAYRIALRIAEPARARVIVIGFLLAPPLWIVSAYWGQVDSVAVLVLFCAILAALSGRMTAAWVLLALAILIKPQSAPIAFVFALWELRTYGLRWQIVRSATLAIVVAYTIALPFSPTLAPAGAFRWLVQRYLVGVAKYPNGSSGAFNAYTIAGPFWASDARTILGVTLHDIGIAGYGVLLAAILVRLWSRLGPAAAERDRRRAFLFACFVALAGLFMIVTRMHERYLLPGLAVGALVALWSVEMAAAEVVLATVFSLNCALILAGFYGGSHHPIVLTTARVASLVNVLAFAAVVVRYFAPEPPPRSASSRTIAWKNARSRTTT